MVTSLDVPLASRHILSLRFQNHWANLGISLPFPPPVSDYDGVHDRQKRSSFDHNPSYRTLTRCSG